MVKGLRDLRRQEAKMIAEELFGLLKDDFRKVAKNVAESVAQTDYEEYLNINEAASILKISPGTLYRTKDRLVKGSYTKVGNQLRFPKSVLMRQIHEGRMRGENM